MSYLSLSLLSFLSLTTRRPIFLFSFLSFLCLPRDNAHSPSQDLSVTHSLSPLCLFRDLGPSGDLLIPACFLTYPDTHPHPLPVACPLKGDPSSQRLCRTPNRLTLVASDTHPLELLPLPLYIPDLQPFPLLWFDFLSHALRLATILIRTVI
jgi:hypothetical protein